MPRDVTSERVSSLTFLKRGKNYLEFKYSQ